MKRKFPMLARSMAISRGSVRSHRGTDVCRLLLRPPVYHKTAEIARLEG